MRRSSRDHAMRASAAEELPEMQVLRTPDDRFATLPGYDFAPHYLEIAAGVADTRLRTHYLDEGPRDADPVLLLHGEPSWSFLYRHMIPRLVAAGHRAVAPDLIGFGRSDKPAAREDYSYQRHVDWLTAFVVGLGLERITLVCQDWGGLLGLRIVAAMPERFARVVAANTFLPTGDQHPGEAFLQWRDYSQRVPRLDCGWIVGRATPGGLAPEVIAAYDAPFPDESFKAGARAFPMLVPISPDDPASEPNRAAWRSLMVFTKPFLTAFSDQDPVTRGADAILQRLIPGAKGQPHTTIRGGGHFLQEDRGPELAAVVIDFIARCRAAGNP
jgi:haloalkane dehalogenase